MGELVPRTVRSDKSKGFDAVGPAAAFALGVAKGAGAAVVREGNLYFVVRLAPVGGGLTRERVYDFEPTGKVVMAVGQDGFTFSARSDDAHKGEYEPDAGVASARSRADRPEDYMARPPPASEMAKLIGMHRPEEGFGKETQAFVDQDAVFMIGDTDLLLRQYFAARALEILERNEQQALDEMTLYRGAPPGQDSTKKMPDEAQLRIAITRAEGIKLNQLLEKEIELEELESKLGRERSTSWASTEEVELIPGSKAMILTWREPRRCPAAGAVVGAAKAWDAISPNNPYKDSLLNTVPSEAADEAIRRSYIEKLDAVLKAVGKVKVEVLTADLRTLAAMPGLRQRVMADLASIKGANARLGELAQIELSRLGSSPGDIAATVIEVAGIALQLAGFFFPPAEFLGSVLTFGASAYKMSNALDNWQVSRASVTGEDGLVDRAQAESALIDSALDVAMQALTVGVSARRRTSWISLSIVTSKTRPGSPRPAKLPIATRLTRLRSVRSREPAEQWKKCEKMSSSTTY
ncbi:Hypothetical protein A7982_01020 [Minicystis rosea]|nr:Hypothetical protein A7982_01020 [Minicystis rosea]